MTTKRPPYEIMTVATLLAGFIAALRGNVWSTVAVFVLAAAAVIMYLARLSIDPNGTIKQEQHEQDLSDIRELIEDVMSYKKAENDTEFLMSLKDCKLDGTHLPEDPIEKSDEYLD